VTACTLYPLWMFWALVGAALVGFVALVAVMISMIVSAWRRRCTRHEKETRNP